MSNNIEIEESLKFAPKFDEDGLIPCITTSAKTSKVLMFAFMNEEALRKTIETGQAHYWSRSRQKLWHKGESSGHVQKIIEMRTDCDQDCIWISVDVQNRLDDACCHTGRESCFYREIPLGDTSSSTLKFSDDEKVFDPDDVY